VLIKLLFHSEVSSIAKNSPFELSAKLRHWFEIFVWGLMIEYAPNTITHTKDLVDFNWK
jgi:hypothetical protein